MFLFETGNELASQGSLCALHDIGHLQGGLLRVCLALGTCTKECRKHRCRWTGHQALRLFILTPEPNRKRTGLEPRNQRLGLAWHWEHSDGGFSLSSLLPPPPPPPNTAEERDFRVREDRYRREFLLQGAICSGHSHLLETLWRRCAPPRLAGSRRF